MPMSETFANGYVGTGRPRVRGRFGISYESEGFPANGPVVNGSDTLNTSWDKLLWAAVTVGRPNRQYVFRHGEASEHEANFRWSLTRMALEQSDPAARQLRRTDAARTLDPSEKGAVSYFLGMTLCKLFSAQLLGAPWALHLDVFRPDLDPILMGGSRPDLVAEISSSGDWVALESKGRVSVPGNEVKNKAKEQAQRLISINGSRPVFRIGAITYFRSDMLQFFWRDPEPDPDSRRKPIKLTVVEEDWRYYYLPTLELVRSQPEYSDRMLREPVLMPVTGADIEVGVYPYVLKHLLGSHWGSAKQWCLDHAEELRRANYQADGIRVVAGDSWFRRFEEFDKPMEL